MANKLIVTAARLRGKTIQSVKVVAGTTYLQFSDTDYAVLQGAQMLKDLAFEEQVALGLVTKADLEALKRLKKMGIATEVIRDDTKTE